MSESGQWVVGKVSVTQGCADYVRTAAEFDTRDAAQKALDTGRWTDEGHPWSGLTTYRVLLLRDGVYYRDDATTAYYPKAESGF